MRTLYWYSLPIFSISSAKQQRIFHPVQKSVPLICRWWPEFTLVRCLIPVHLGDKSAIRSIISRSYWFEVQLSSLSRWIYWDLHDGPWQSFRHGASKRPFPSLRLITSRLPSFACNWDHRLQHLAAFWSSDLWWSFELSNGMITPKFSLYPWCPLEPNWFVYIHRANSVIAILHRVILSVISAVCMSTNMHGTWIAHHSG